MTEGFPQATAADMQPHTIYTNSTPNDPAAVLPDAAAAKFVQLKQRCLDLHAATPAFADVQEQSHAKIRHEKRIADLTRVRAEGGFGLSELAPQVVAERRELERAQKEFTRLTTLKEARGARWTVAKQLEARVSDWVLRGGIPGGCTLEVVEDAPLSELLTKNDGGRIDAAVERYRHRLRELAADLHRVRSAPWPSSVAREKARTQIEQLAEAAAPNLDSMIEHGSSKVGFAQMSLSSLVRGTETPALAFTETADTLGLLCWLLKDQLLAKINASLDEIADDKAALSQQQREEAEAQISSDMLAIERLEVACIWHAEAAKGEIIDFRGGTSPQSLLGIKLVNQPHTNGSGTSWMHAIDIRGWR
jgi:hypothetical protein